MKKILSLVLVLVMMLSFAACASKGDAKDTTADVKDTTENTEPAGEYKYLNDGVLTVGAEMTYAPFEMMAEDGVTPIGYDVDLAKAIGEKLGVKVEFINTAWDGIFEGIGVNYDVVISAVTVDPDRQKTMLFSDPYIDNYQTIVVPADSTLEFKSLTDLDGHSVAFQKETTSDKTLSDLIDAGTIKSTKVDCEKVIACFSQLANGEVDVVLCDSSVAKDYVSKNPEKYKIAYTDSESPEQFAVAMKLDNKELQTLINKALAELKSEGYLDEIYSYWILDEKGE